MADVDAITELCESLEQSFTIDELVRLLRASFGQAQGVKESELPNPGQSTAGFVSDVVSLLQRRELLGHPAFWDGLVRERPNLKDRIARLRERLTASRSAEPAVPPPASTIEQLIERYGVGLILARLHNGARHQGWLAVRIRAEPGLSVRSFVDAYLALYQPLYERHVSLVCNEPTLANQLLAILGPSAGPRRRCLVIWEPLSTGAGGGQLPHGSYDLIALGPNRLKWVPDLKIEAPPELLTEACDRLRSRFGVPEHNKLDRIQRETGQHFVLLVALEEILRRLKPSDLAARIGQGLDLGPAEERRLPGSGRSAYAALAVISELCRSALQAQTGQPGVDCRAHGRALQLLLAELVPLAREPLEGLRRVFEGGRLRVAAVVLRVVAHMCPGFVIPMPLLCALVRQLASEEPGQHPPPSEADVLDACFLLREQGLLCERRDHEIVVSALEQALIILAVGVARHQRDHVCCGEVFRQIKDVLPDDKVPWPEQGVSIPQEGVHLIHWLWSSRRVLALGGGD